MKHDMKLAYCHKSSIAKSWHSALCTFFSTGIFPQEHPEEHGIHVSPGKELHNQQGDAKPLPVLPPAEVSGSGHVQGV